MQKKQSNKSTHNAPGVSVTVHIHKVPDGYIKDVPIKGCASGKAIDQAVASVVSSRGAAKAMGRMTIQKSRITKGERVRISNSDTGFRAGTRIKQMA